MARSAIEPQWLKSIQIGGLDQLGVQMISITLYGELLPGLTNVTDRVRYYSFYPWVLHRYAKDVRSTSRKTWQEHLRRADFLLALVACVHHADGEEGGESVVGSIQATKTLAKMRERPRQKFTLSKWTAVDRVKTPGSYFANRQGGFGQYYKGVIRDLGLVEFQDKSPGVFLTRERGRSLAETCDGQPGRDEFWELVKADAVSYNELKTLGQYVCPCRLSSFAAERDSLLRVLFEARSESDLNTRRRTDSLRLLLSFLRLAKEKGTPWSGFQLVAYYGHERNKKQISTPEGLETAAAKWQVYETGEYIHRSLEEAFRALLQKMKDRPVPVGTFAADAARRALAASSKDIGLGRDRTPWAKRPVDSLLDEAKSSQLAPSDWEDDPWSEENLIGRAIEQSDPNRALALSLACIISTIVRGASPENPFELYEAANVEFLSRYPLHIASVRNHLMSAQDAPASDVFASLMAEKILLRHLRVAMRKLRYELQSTFKFVIEDGHYVWVEDFEPTYTNPRLRQGFLFLRDLGLCSGGSGGWSPTELGMAVLRGTHAFG